MKLLFFSSTKYYGGGSYASLRFAHELAKKGNEVCFFSDSTANAKMLLGNENTYMRFREFPTVPHIAKGFGMLDRLNKKVFDFVNISSFKKYHYQIVIGEHIEQTLRASYYAEKLQAKLVTFQYETPLYYEERFGADFFKNKKRFLGSWERLEKVLHRTDLIIAISHLVKSKIIDWIGNGDKIIVAYPGFDFDAIDASPSCKKSQQIIYVGRISRSKNVAEIFRALERVRKDSCVDLQLVLLGRCEEPYTTEVRKVASETKVRYRLLGQTSERDKWVELKKSLFSVFPTSFEGFGLPPGEALSCEIPCVATDLPILREVYEDKLEYFPEHNVDALAEKIEYLLANPSYRERRGQEGGIYVRERYSWEKSASKFQESLKDLIEAS